MADRSAGPVAAAPARRATELTGWGRIAPSTALLAEPADPAQVAGLLAGAPSRGAIARGLGRSYNNAAQCGGGLVIGTTAMHRILSLDTGTGLAVCEAGVSMEQLMVAGLPSGWFVPVSPGTRQVTVGGAIAADVHGKNHHAAGSFAPHVPWFDLLLPAGRQCRVTPGDDPRLFWATAGGMGLTGIILAAAVQLTPVQTSRVRGDTVRPADVDETMACLSGTDDRYGYTVAWTDCLARGASLGRSVITSGDFAAPGDLGPKDRRGPAGLPARRAPARPAGLPGRAAEPGHGRAGQRGLVPQGPAQAGGGDPDHRRVLPPAGRDQELEQRVRPGGLPPVPVRGAVRPGAGGPPGAGADQRRPGSLVRDRAQAVRPGRPRIPVLPDAGLDAGAGLPGGHRGPGRAAGPAGRRCAGRRRPGLPGQGLPGAARGVRRDVPPAGGVPQTPRRARPRRRTRLRPVPPPGDLMWRSPP